MAINIAINGAAGRMGRCLIQAVAETGGLELSALGRWLLAAC